MADVCAVCGKSDAALLRCGRCASRYFCGEECQKADWPTHKGGCKRQNYILKVSLLPGEIINPPINRTLSCPATATFVGFHEALLVAFGWANTHLYDFNVLPERNNNAGIFNSPRSLLKIANLDDFDDFDMPGMPVVPQKESEDLKLYSILDDPKLKGKTIQYEYDFGDGWEHMIVCIGRADLTTHFVCISGEGHGAAEDVGGSYGWNALLAAYDADVPTADEREKMKWYETFASNMDPGGLRGAKKLMWDKEKVNAILSQNNIQQPSTSTSSESHSILLVSLMKESWLNEMYAKTLTKLRSKATVTETTHWHGAHLSQELQTYKAIILTDAAILKTKFAPIRSKLTSYARGGGIVIMGFLCSTFAELPHLTKYFKSCWDLPWEAGDYHREEFFLNALPGATFKIHGHTDLLSSYSMKALHLKNVNHEDQVYVSNPIRDQSPAAFAKYGSGYLGWIGDVNGEAGSTEVLLTMCDV